MPKHYNLARMTTATTGTGTITLGSAATGFLSFAGAGAVDGDVCTYGIEDGTNREVGIGTYSASGTTLTRTIILSSTNSGAAISLSGSAQVFSTIAAQDLPLLPSYWNPPPASKFSTLVTGPTSPTLTNDPQLGLIYTGGTPVGGNIPYGVWETCPTAGTDFTVTMHFTPVGPGVNYYGVGLGLYSATDVKTTLWQIQFQNSLTVLDLNEHTSTTLSGQPVSITMPSLLPQWLRISRTGTTLTYSYSFDGVYWYVGITRSQTAYFSVAPSHIGIGNFYNETYCAARAYIDYWSQTW